MSAGDPCERDGCTETVPRRRSDSDARAAGRRFCCLACYRAHVHVDRPTRTCETCGATFGPSTHERPAQFVKRDPRFCSQLCNGAAKTSRRPHAVPHCTVCRVEIERDPAHGPARHARRRRCTAHVGAAVSSRARRTTTRPLRAPRAARPVVLSPFGDLPPSQPWRPAGFAPLPTTKG